MDLKTIQIKGKPYVEVKERVKYFRNQENFKGWCIQTKMKEFDAKEYVLIRADIYNSEGVLVSSGHAMEEKTGHINSTSMVENCETSAVGRALGLLGIGIDAAIASADEMISSKPQWWSDAIKYLNEGGKIEMITKKYSLTDELKAELMEDAANI